MLKFRRVKHTGQINDVTWYL